VAQPLERQFAQIPGVAQMTSTSYLERGGHHQSTSTANIDGAANRRSGGDQRRSGPNAKKLP